MEEENVSMHQFNDNGYERLVELSETTYAGREICDLKFLQWEYDKNPDGKAFVTVGECKNKVVAQYIVLPRDFSINGSIVKGSLSVNTLTHPDHRGKGLFPGLAAATFKSCRENNIAFTIGFPNPLSSPVIKKRNIFETAGNLPLLVRPLRPLRSALSLFQNSKNKTGDDINIKIVMNEITGRSEISLFDPTTDKENYDELISRFNESKMNVTFRSLQFFKWRFIDIVLRKYHILKSTVNGKINAIVVFRVKEIFGLRCGILIDLISIDDHKGVKELLNAINDIAKGNELDLIFTTMPKNSQEYKILKGSGYFSVPQFLLPQRLVFIIQRHLQICPPGISDLNNWFLTFGDYDIF